MKQYEVIEMTSVGIMKLTKYLLPDDVEPQSDEEIKEGVLLHGEVLITDEDMERLQIVLHNFVNSHNNKFDISSATNQLHKTTLGNMILTSVVSSILENSK